jgi:hypothetical protein
MNWATERVTEKNFHVAADTINLAKNTFLTAWQFNFCRRSGPNWLLIAHTLESAMEAGKFATVVGDLHHSHSMHRRLKPATDMLELTEVTFSHKEL